MAAGEVAGGDVIASPALRELPVQYWAWRPWGGSREGNKNLSALVGDEESDCGVSGKNVLAGGEAGSRPNGEYVIAAVVAICTGKIVYKA